MSDERDMSNDGPFLEAFGVYAIERLQRGNPSMGPQDKEILEAFKVAFRAGFEYGRQS